ncbi:MAG: FecR domain-containing protein [Desulfobacterales bacterium]|nr:FecR domain-containing protein [Desulfobacterales bacterium]
MSLRLFASIIALFVFAGSALADATVVRLVAVSGKVFIQVPGGDEIRARAGKTLVPGTRIRTGDDGQAEVSFDDGSSIIVQNNTSLVLSGIKRHNIKKTSILIFFGRIWNKISRKVGVQASYEVNTPIFICGVRGTEFETAVGDDGSVRVRVSEGQVGVADGGGDKTVKCGEEVEADIDGVGKTSAAGKEAEWDKWHERKRKHLQKQGRSIIDKFKHRIMTRKEKLEALRARQKEVEAKRKRAEERARAGESRALEEIRGYNRKLVEIADEIADLGDAAGSQFGLVDHFADLATDPLFQMVDGKYVKAEAESMRRIKAMFDKMIAEGTDISMEAMDKMLREMSDGQRGSLRFKKGSSAEDLFVGEEMDIKP